MGASADAFCAGLGLSLAREIARAHQGDVVLHELGESSVSFRLSLPAEGASGSGESPVPAV